MSYPFPPMRPSRRARSARRRPSHRDRPGNQFNALAEGLEPRLLLAMAHAAGGSGYSGTLSVNAAIRQQQLICDPDEPISGSTSVQYDASLVSLALATPGPGYGEVLDGYVEVTDANGTPFLQPLQQFLRDPAGKQTGYAQVAFGLVPGGKPGQMQPPEGFNIVDEAGPDGVDTFALGFQLLPRTPDNADFKYRVFAAAEGEHGTRGDVLVAPDGTQIPPGEIAPATVSTAAEGVTLSGGLGDDKLVINATGPASGSYSLGDGPAIRFANLSNFTFVGGGGNDTLQINNPAGGLFAPPGGIDYDGGGQAADGVTIFAGLADDGTYTPGPTPDAGVITHSGASGTQVVRFTGLAPATDTVPEANFTINATDAANRITVDDGTALGDGMLRVAIDTFEPLQFANKRNVTINGGTSAADAGDQFLLNYTDTAAGLATLTADGGAGNDTFNVNSLAGPVGSSSVRLTGGDGSDTFTVVPSATVPISVNGSLPAPPAAPGDRLFVDTTAAGAPFLDPTAAAGGFAGTYTFANRQAVGFSQIETPSASTDLSITKTDGQTTAFPGFGITYTIVVANNGPLGVSGVTVSDALPPSLLGASWTASIAGGATATQSGSGNISQVVSLPAGGSVTYTVHAAISATASGTLSNTATVAAPAGVTDTNTSNNSATDTSALVVPPAGTTKIWDGGAGTFSWHDAANWGPDGVPGPADVVYIPDSAPDITVLYSTGASNIARLNSEETVEISGGTLGITSIVAASTSRGLTISGGTLAGGATLTVNGAFNWTAGTLSGSGVTEIAATASSSMNNAFAGALVLDARTLLNRSPTATWQVADLKFQNAATFDNRGTVLLDNFGIEPDNTAPSKIVNSGTLRVSGLGGSFWVPVTNAASGVVEVWAGNGAVFYRTFDNAGTLSVTGGGSSTAFYSGGTSSGSFVLNGTGKIGVAGGNYQLAGGATITHTGSGLGHFVIDSVGGIGGSFGTVTVGGAVSSGAGVQIEQYTGILTGTGTLTVNGSYAWFGGTQSGNGQTVITSTGSVGIQADGRYPPLKLLDGRALINNSPASFWNANELRLQNGAVLDNRGTLAVQSDVTLSDGGGTPSQVTNSGTLVKTGGAGTATFAPRLTNQSAGTLQISAGALSLNGSFENQGTVKLDPAAAYGALLLNGGGQLGGTFQLNDRDLRALAGSYQFQAGVGMTSTGGWFRLFGGTLNVPTAVTLNALFQQGNATVDGPGDFTLNRGFIWSGGRHGGTGQTIVPVNFQIGTDGFDPLVLDGRTITTSASVCQWFREVEFVNGAALVNQGTIYLDGAGSLAKLGAGAPGQIRNAGSLVKRDVSSSGVPGGPSTVSVPFVNQPAGTLEVRDHSLTLAAAFDNQGTVRLDPTALPTALAASGAFQNSGTLDLGGRAASAASYAQTAAGTLKTTIGGTTTVGQLLVTGPATLAGTLGITTATGFTPAPGDNFQVLTFGSRAGTFAAVTSSLAAGPVYRARYDPAVVSVHLNSAPVGQADTFTTSEDVPLTIAAPGVLANDTDADGDALSALLVSGPSHGALSLSANGSFIYAPAADYNGADSFTYRASDGAAQGNVTTVSLTINSVNDAPVATLGPNSPGVGGPVAPGGAYYWFRVTYTDDGAVDYHTIGNTDVLVTGPGGYSQMGTLSNLVAGGGGYQTTYKIPAPGGTWNAKDNGTYTLSLRAGEIADTQGLAAPAATLGTLLVAVPDLSPPAASLSATDVTTPGGVYYWFNVSYTDDSAVDYRTIGNTDVLVTGPGGYSQIGILSNLVSTGSGDYRVTYRISAPGGIWDAPDNGTYVVNMRANEVGDTAGKFVPAGVLGTFAARFADSTPPTATLSSSNVTTAGGVYYWFQVAYSDNAGINWSTIGSGDVEVGGPNGFLQSAVLSNLTTSGGVWTTTYRITAPGGTFGAEDNGSYTVTMRPSEVSDTSGNSVPAGAIGAGFQVNIPAPAAAAGVASASSPFSDVVISPVSRATGTRSDYALSDLLA